MLCDSSTNRQSSFCICTPGALNQFPPWLLLDQTDTKFGVPWSFSGAGCGAELCCSQPQTGAALPSLCLQEEGDPTAQMCSYSWIPVPEPGSRSSPSSCRAALGWALGSVPQSCPRDPCPVGAEGRSELAVTCLSLIAVMHTEY